MGTPGVKGKWSAVGVKSINKVTLTSGRITMTIKDGKELPSGDMFPAKNR
jgi:hypothetical protein